MGERLMRAAMVAAVNATVTASLSFLLGLPHIWPGAISTFVFTLALWYLLVSPRRTRGGNRDH